MESSQELWPIPHATTCIRGNGSWLSPGRLKSKPSQRHALHYVVGTLLQNERRARTRRQNVILEIGEVGPLPDRDRGGGGFLVGQQRIAVEVGFWIGERGVAQRQEA